MSLKICKSKKSILTSFCLGATAAVLLLTIALSGRSPELWERLEPTGFVNDFAGILSPAEISALEQEAQKLESSSDAELSVVTVTSLEGGEIRDTANRLFERWGIGKEDEDTGVLMLMSVEDREVWVEIGYGLEPILPDGRVGRILDQAVIPFFREGRYGAGLLAGTQAITAVIRGDSAVQNDSLQQDSSRGGIIIPLLFGLVMLYLIIRHPWLAWLILSQGRGGAWGSGGGFGRGGGFGGGGFGGFGGGLSGGGGAGRSW